MPPKPSLYQFSGIIMNKMVFGTNVTCINVPLPHFETNHSFVCQEKGMGPSCFHAAETPSNIYISAEEHQVQPDIILYPTLYSPAHVQI